MVSFEYLCFISKVTIFMTVAPTIPMEGQQFNIAEGSNGSITCTATGYPVPTVVWQNSDGSSLSNNRLVSGNPVNVPTDVGNVTSVSVELMVIGAMRVDSGMYRCSANNNVSNTTRNISITVQCKLYIYEHVYHSNLFKSVKPFKFLHHQQLIYYTPINNSYTILPSTPRIYVNLGLVQIVKSDFMECAYLSYEYHY